MSKWPESRGKRCVDLWQIVSTKLRSCLRGWNGNWGGDLKKRKQDLMLLIKSLDQKADRGGLEEREWEQRYVWEEELIDIYSKEEVMWQTRGGDRWLLEGDANTAYFHGIANGRKRKCLIRSLEDEGSIITEANELKAHITDYYKRLFGSEGQSKLKLHPDTWKDNLNINDEDNAELTKPFTMGELEVVVQEMKSGSAHGPDGFSAIFFKVFWNQVILLEILQDLREGSLDLFRLNYGILTLIPKVKGATNIRQYRPICLLNVVYKIITKTLTLRLNRVINKVIGPNQTAFIPGRYILDGVVIIHEVLHEIAKNKQKGIVLKLDFEKVYDKVRWSFLEEVMYKKGFNETFIQWVMKAVRGGRVAVNLNGELGTYFRSYKGLRQGDPLSPLLFNLVADGLSAMLESATRKGVISGVTPHLVEGGLTHLQYADDTVLFIQNTEVNILNLKFILFCFEEISGMEINYHKSEVLTVGIDEVETGRIANAFNCKVGNFFFNVNFFFFFECQGG